MAFAEALRIGVDGIEFDVHLSKDHELIIMHDDRVDRTTDGTGAIIDLTLAELKTLSAGVFLHQRFKDERIPTLTETLDLITGDVMLNVHVKAYDYSRELLTKKVVQELTERQIWHRAFIASDAETVKLAQSLNPSAALCNLTRQGNPIEYVEFSEELGCQILQPSHRITTPELVEAAHSRGMRVNVFYADEVEEMKKLMEMGVDGILTNFPARLKRVRESVLDVK
jgi:glycerophosphoryl diester phosphodiesterase